ncbi:MAG: TetR/AcrR family transcriptional regulator [Candidatus Melainabacteria bacterium]|jgi:AcrR family transcriptional regulator|nr:TetR/AcrR family transcriptional regulator [Candidatus Melainabacteria bacterium]
MARTKSIHNRAELIEEAAVELFSRYGYERTSIEDIAKHLGIGKGSVYLEFRTKEEILMRVVEKHALKIQAMMDERTENIKGSPLESLKDTFLMCALMVYDYVTRDFHTPEALLYTSLQFKPRFSAFYVKKRERVLKFLKRAAEAGEISPKKANEKTAITFLMGAASLFPPYFNNYTESEQRMTRDELEQNAKALLKILVNGLRETSK